MKCEPFLLVSTIKLVIAQRLVRRLDDNKIKYILSKDELEQINKKVNMNRILECLRKEKIVPENADWSTINFYKPNIVDENTDG